MSRLTLTEVKPLTVLEGVLGVQVFSESRLFDSTRMGARF